MGTGSDTPYVYGSRFQTSYWYVYQFYYFLEMTCLPGERNAGDVTEAVNDI